MTDGCGFINGAGLAQISKTMQYTHRPTSIQGRIAGDKGMWLLHPEDQDPTASPPTIWIRDSQRKIRHPPFSPSDRALLIFNLLAPSKVNMNCNLSMLSINNLYHNNVPDSVFQSLMRKNIESVIQPLMQWDGSLVPMARTVSTLGSITGSRLRRLAAGTSRAQGFIRDFRREADPTTEELPDDFSPSDLVNATGRDLYSGAPKSLHESTYELLQGGFHPAKNIVLRNKLHKICKLAIEGHTKDLKIPVPESVEVHMVPGKSLPYILIRNSRAFYIIDPTGKLRPGEIYFCSSQSLVDPHTGRPFNKLLGPVIAGAYHQIFFYKIDFVPGWEKPHSIAFGYTEGMVEITALIFKLNN